MLTTQEAQKLALKWATEKQWSHSKIGMELAKMGYVSFRTGKPVSGGGVGTMIRREEQGIIPANREPVKHAAKREIRVRRFHAKTGKITTETYTPEATRMPPITRPAYELDHEAMARQTLTAAAEKLLFNIFGTKMRVTIPLDVAVR